MQSCLFPNGWKPAGQDFIESWGSGDRLKCQVPSSPRVGIAACCGGSPLVMICSGWIAISWIWIGSARVFVQLLVGGSLDNDAANKSES